MVSVAVNQYLLPNVAIDFEKLSKAYGNTLPLKRAYVPLDKQKVLGTTNDNGWGIAFDLKDDTPSEQQLRIRVLSPVYGFETRDGLHYVYVRTDV